MRSAGWDVDECPLADGGEGTLDVLAPALGGEWRSARVSDAYGGDVEARWLWVDGVAYVEAAEAIGLGERRDPLRASSRGLGELALAALVDGPRELVVCLGGVATVDGGAGFREVVDVLPVPTRVACDVRNPLLGPRGAARAFGPQKGASPADVEELELRVAAMDELTPFAEIPGAGAAGGLGAALAALGAELVSGADFVLEAVRFRERVRGVELAITGEGTVDASTFEGKAPGEALRACREAGVRSELFAGAATPDFRALVHKLPSGPARARDDLVALGRELASDRSEARS